jgi:putative hemolysin
MTQANINTKARITGAAIAQAAAFALVMTTAQPASAQKMCIRQSLLNHDYCGAEGGKLQVPERAIGNFKGACAGHDACYSFAASDVVKAMERRYQKSMLSASAKEKREFLGSMAIAKTRCDAQFRSSMGAACNNVNPALRKQCGNAANAYFGAVTVAAWGAFNSSVDRAFTCRF